MCIGDDAHFDLLDYMVELDGAPFVERLRARWAGAAEYDADRAWDFLVNGPGETLRANRLALIGQARQRLRIEMAFFGDPAFSDAICAAVDRGVHTTIVAARRAGKLRWYNPHVFNTLRARTGAPPHLRIALHRQVVHAKLVVVDDTLVDVGSANFTRLSHEGYGETNLYLNDSRVARRLGWLIDTHAAQARVTRRRIRYSKVRARLELHFMNRAGTAAQRRIDAENEQP
jgi:cardiolipin synthase